MKALKKVISSIGQSNSNRMIVSGYLSYVLIGSLVLSIPFFAKASPLPFLDNLFTATSAVSTTGLVTVSVSDNYSFWGQLIIVILIQLGGLGYMTVGSFVILSFYGKLSLSRDTIQRSVFNLTDRVGTRKLIRLIVLYSLTVELLGAIFLFVFFSFEKMPHSIWSAVFHSVSAFCTAGFGLYNNSLETFYDNIGINVTISILCLLGSIGFIVIYDVWYNNIKGKTPITLTSKIIIRSTLLLILIGTVILFLFEPSVVHEAFANRLTTSFFQSMTALTTAGFNTIPISPLSVLSFFVITLLMIVGASPSGTGGGLKTTTFTALIGVMKSTLRGEREVKYSNRTIPAERIWLAVSSLCFYLTVLLLSTFFLLLSRNHFNFQEVLFEVASALGTVGLTTGITTQLNDFEKIIIIITMFIGRIGPLSFGVALFLDSKNAGTIRFPEEDIPV